MSNPPSATPMITSQERQNLKDYPNFYQELFNRLCLYWKGSEKKSAWFLLLGTIFLTLAIVGCQAVITFWYNQFYNSLQRYDVKEFWRLMGWFLIFALTYISCAIAKKYFFQL
jgi:putative ATP-binding cassette transporter